jgi:peptide/nickel transport system substrate-binding protein
MPYWEGRACLLVSLVLVGTLTAAACSGGGSRSRLGGGRQGGSITVAAEQWPQCLNPITSCTSSLPDTWTVANQVLPRAMEITPRGDYVASPVLSEEPSQANGGLRQSPNYSVTFRISKEAVWDDGSPITSRDFAFTWRAVMATKPQSANTTYGYDHIQSVDASQPKVAVVTFRDVWPDWRDLFGGASYLLKAAAFPRGPDLSTAMATDIPFSAGPWKLQSWTPDQAVLVANHRYWDKQRTPHLDHVTIVRRDNPTSQLDELLAGRVAAIYPTPTPSMTDTLTSPGVRFTAGGGPSFEGIFFNLAKPPVNDVQVREAVAYALDRQAIADATIGRAIPGSRVLNCGWLIVISDLCDNSHFADLTHQPARAKAILEQAGWTEGRDGVLTKDGKKLTLEWSTTSCGKGCEDRITSEQLAAQQLHATGIEVTVRNAGPGDLFTNRLPQGDFTIANYAQLAVGLDPAGMDALYASGQIPSAANDYSGGNLSFWNNPAIDALIAQAANTFDQRARVRIYRTIDTVVRHEVVWLPLYETPTIIAWRNDRLAGPIDADVSSYYGGFANLYEWSIR